LRDSIAYAGELLTETEPLFGDHFGQVLVSLHTRQDGMRDTHEVVAALKPLASGIAGPVNLRFWGRKDGPPTYKPIVVKVRGDRFDDIRAAADALRRLLTGIPGVRDIADDDSGGTRALTLRPDTDAARRAGLPAAEVMRLARLYGEGEIAATLRSEGDRLDVRVRAKPEPLPEIDALLRAPVALPGGGDMPLSALVRAERGAAKANVRHHNYRRAITVDAELDKTVLDTPQAVARLRAAWEAERARFPDVDLEFGGELDDIQESLDALLFLFLLGVGLIYLILGTQFNSYWQPFMILATLPMAFVGVVVGLMVSGYPLSLFTMYGVVALAGVAVNSAIVMVTAANERLAQGMSVTHAIVYAARRRLVPILITSITTIMGLASLAAGFGGKSLLWGPVAAAIVWGLTVSTVLTLFLIPLLYRYFMNRSARPT
jgi:multidrug efflux pump subunit AcrB